MLEFMIAWGLIGFMLFVILGGAGAAVKSTGDDWLAQHLALGALVGLVWPIALVAGVVYIVLWTLKQGSDALWTSNEKEKDNGSVQEG